MSQSEQSISHDEAPTIPQLCMGIVQDFSKGNLSKVLAVRGIFAAFSESGAYDNTPQADIDTAIETYMGMLDEHGTSHSIVAVCGSWLDGTERQVEERNGEDYQDDYEDEPLETTGSKRG